jgi:hypothetical protein
VAVISASPNKGYSHGYYCLCIEFVKVEEAIKAGDLTAAEGRTELARVRGAMHVEWTAVWDRYSRQMRGRGR